MYSTLAQELDLSLKRSASTNGGEYKSKCPQCKEGKDRFCIWPNQGESGRYWCRVCDCRGDGIQFCRDFLGMSFHQACQKIEIIPLFRKTLHRRKQNTFVPKLVPSISPSWQRTAKNFVAFSHQKLMTEFQIIDQLKKRGLTVDTMKRFFLGWNPENLFDQRERWGLAPEIKENGLPKRQWLPKGFVIPSFCNADPVKMKIRRSDWFNEDTLPKYVEISGSRQSPSVYGDMSKPVMIVESELDAILIQQEASDLVCCLALGGVSKKPDAELHARLKKSPLILLALDFDEAGKKRNSFWMRLYPNARLWPIPFDKSPGDAIEKSHVNIVSWIKSGLFVI